MKKQQVPKLKTAHKKKESNEKHNKCTQEMCDAGKEQNTFIVKKKKRDEPWDWNKEWNKEWNKKWAERWDREATALIKSFITKD